MNETKLQEAAGRLVANEVHLCVSSLVHTLATAQGSRWRVIEEEEDVYSLMCQAFELSTPVLDYEEAARQAEWMPDEFGQWRKTSEPENEGDLVLPTILPTAEFACAEDNLDPYEWEVFEHWVVSDWLADELIKRGQKVDKDFAGMAVWARTTTGQAISMDGVIRDIVRELYAA